MSDLEALADLQDLDKRLDQLRHRREHLPESDSLVQLAHDQGAVEATSASLSGQRHELEREQKRLEDEVASVEQKKKADADRMYTMTSPKDASALQAEIESLGRRQDQFEEEILEFMEQIEPLTAQLNSHHERLTEMESEKGRIEAAIAVAEAEIDAEVEDLEATVIETRTVVPEELLERYSKLRSTSRDGVVIGRVANGRCSACGLRFSSVFMDGIKHSEREELLQCDECGVLLVP